jgi:hypothetical protein
MTTIQNSQSINTGSLATSMHYALPQMQQLPNNLKSSSCQGNYSNVLTQGVPPPSVRGSFAQEIGAVLQQALQPLVQIFEALLAKFAELLGGQAQVGAQAGPQSAAAGAAAASTAASPGVNSSGSAAPTEQAASTNSSQAPKSEESSLNKIFEAVKMIFEGASTIGGLSKGLGKKVSKGVKALGKFVGTAVSSVGSYLMGGPIGKAAKGLLSKIF